MRLTERLGKTAEPQQAQNNLKATWNPKTTRPAPPARAAVT